MTLPSIRLDHCVIASSDFTRSDPFYTRVLGAEVFSPRAEHHIYRIGGQVLSVHGPGAARLTGPKMLAAKPVAPGGSDLCFEWDGSIEEAVAHLETCGVPVETGPVDRTGARGAGISVYFRDPDGSLLEFISYAGARRVPAL
jgi:catechol 2,3-dioxygenase-like lactoylglutathione lyase family enzyme